MANMFSVEPANPLQALMTGVQGYDAGAKRTKEAEIMAGRAKAMQALQSGGDLRNVLGELLGIGEDKLAQVVGTFAQHQQQAAHQAAALAETKRYHSGTLGIQQGQLAETARHRTETLGIQQGQLKLAQDTAAAAAKGFDYKEVDDGDGGKALVRIEKATGKVDRPQISGVQTDNPTNPYAHGKQTESQSKDSLYASRMFAAESVFRSIEKVADTPDSKSKPVENVGTSYVERAKATVGGKIGYNINTERYQKFDQAKRDFINATLRRESGAVISPAEFENAEQQYFPVPGNPKSIIDQKRANRAEAIKGIAAGGGKSYRTPMVFDQEGNLVDNPREGAKGPAPVPAPSPTAPAPPPSAGPPGFVPLGSLIGK